MSLQVEQLERSVDFLSECPHPNKVVFRSAAKARKRARELHMDWYKCVCGSWHLTTPPDYEPPCPVCGAPINEYESCGCYEELHYGR